MLLTVSRTPWTSSIVRWPSERWPGDPAMLVSLSRVGSENAWHDVRSIDSTWSCMAWVSSSSSWCPPCWWWLAIRIRRGHAMHIRATRIWRSQPQHPAIRVRSCTCSIDMDRILLLSRDRDYAICSTSNMLFCNFYHVLYMTHCTCMVASTNMAVS